MFLFCPLTTATEWSWSLLSLEFEVLLESKYWVLSLVQPVALNKS